MKRMVFKKWVNWLIVGVMLLSIMTIAGECESTIIFIASKGIAVIVFYASYKLLAKFGRHEVL